MLTLIKFKIKVCANISLLDTLFQILCALVHAFALIGNVANIRMYVIAMALFPGHETLWYFILANHIVGDCLVVITVKQLWWNPYEIVRALDYLRCESRSFLRLIHSSRCIFARMVSFCFLFPANILK